MCHFVFDYNSGVSNSKFLLVPTISNSIFILVVQVLVQERILYNLLIQRLDDVITASHRTSQKFTSYSYF